MQAAEPDERPEQPNELLTIKTGGMFAYAERVIYLRIYKV